MNIGKMKFRVMLQKPAAPIANAIGEEITQFEDVAPVWAAIRPLTSTEVVRARRVQLDTTHLVNIRYFAGLTSEWRLQQLTYGSAIFNIRGVMDPTMQRVELNLDCVVSSDG